MGCGASKGKAEGGNSTESTDINFKKTNCYQMDDFFDKAMSTLKSFKDITGPLGDQKDNYFDVTGFYEVPGASKYRYYYLRYSIRP
jgi:hypothetical protein